MRHTHSDTHSALVPCAVLLLLPLLHTPASAPAVLLLILMFPLLRVQHHQSYGYRVFIFSEDTTGCAACCDLTGIAGHCYIRVLLNSMGFPHADRVFVIGDADCEPSTIQPKRKGALSVMLQHGVVRVPIFRRLIDEIRTGVPVGSTSLLRVPRTIKV